LLQIATLPGCIIKVLINMKKYDFVAINHVLSDAMLPFLCILVVLLSDRLEIIEPRSIRMICNIAMVLLVSTIYNRLSNKLFRMKVSVECHDDFILLKKNNKETIIEYKDINEVQVSVIKSVFGNSIGGKVIEFVVKGTKRKIKIISNRYFNNEDLFQHPLIDTLYFIQNKTSNFVLSFDNDGSVVILKRTDDKNADIK